MDGPAQRAETFLNAYGLSLDDVRGCTGDVPPWETVIFGGSIPEGLANADSDIDILLVGDSVFVDAAIPPYQVGDTAIRFQPNLGRFRVQVETVPIAHLQSVRRQMAEVAAGFETPENAVRSYWLTELDARTIHRISTGICIVNPAVADQWNRQLRSDLLPTYLLATSLAQHKNLLEDALGEAAQDRRASALWALKYAVGFAAGALLASIGQTNPNAKWWVRLLELHRDEAGRELADGLVERMVGRSTEPFAAYLSETCRLCGEVAATALARNPLVAARREHMAARARDAGVSFPGAKK